MYQFCTSKWEKWVKKLPILVRVEHTTRLFTQRLGGSSTSPYSIIIIMETVKKRCRRCGCRLRLRRKINIKEKVANLQLPPVDKVAYMLNRFIQYLELTSEVDPESDSDADTVIVGDGDVGNLNDF